MTMPRRALLHLGDLRLPVTVLAVRVLFGRTDYHVTPEGGTGDAWISAKHITPTEGEP